MDRTEYQRYLRSAHWRKTRTHIRRRARGWCERCRVGKRADVHHLTYTRLGAEADGDLVAVCDECHDWLHGRRTLDPAATHYPAELVPLIRRWETLRAKRLSPAALEVLLRGFPALRAAAEFRRQAVGERVERVA